MSKLRFIRISASTAFNGTAPLTTKFVPDNNPNQPLVSVTQANIGRLSFRDLLRPGSSGGLFKIRAFAVEGLVVAIKSPTEAEIEELATPDVPPPVDLNATLQTVAVTSQWSEVLMAGPSDALTLTNGRGTVEIALADVDGEDLLRQWAAESARPLTPPVQVQTITESTELAPWTGDLFVYFEPADPNATITLPASAVMSGNARLHLAHTGGSWGVVEADGSDTINGGAELLIGENKETLITFVDGVRWIATDAPVIPDLGLANAAAGATVDLPVIFGTRIISVAFTAYGNLRFPPIADVPRDATYILQRTGDSSATPPIPAQCKLVVEDAADTMDGVADDVRYLDGLGSVIIVRRAAGGWVTVGNRQDVADQTILVTGTGYTFASGWIGTKYVRSTAAGATTVTGPPSARTPIGCRLAYVCEGAGGGTLSCDANIISAGASAATLAAAQLAPRVIEFNGTNWIST